MSGDGPPASRPNRHARSLGLFLAAWVLTLSYLGLCAEIWDRGMNFADPFDLVDLFSLSHEVNLPTWAASTLHAAAALLLFGFAARPESPARDRRIWRLLSAIFAYISVDEFVQIHEQMNHWFDWGGVLYFGWVVPAAAAVGILAISMLGFLRRRPPQVRRRMILAACLFVGGAIGIELILGWWTDQSGDDNFTYALIDWVEETMELSGIALFVHTLATHLEENSDRSETRMPVKALTLRGKLALITGWFLAGLLGGWTLLQGFETYFEYQDHRGSGPTQMEYLGEDLRDVLTGGERFRFSGTASSFERNPKERILAVQFLGFALLMTSLIGLWPRPTDHSAKPRIEPEEQPLAARPG